MRSLILYNLRHIFRSKLFYLFFAFSTMLHFFGLKLLHKLTITIEGVFQIIGPREGIFFSLYFELFIGVFLATVYGIWLVPHLHTGQRMPLSFSLPVSKWKFPVGYFCSFLVLILIEQAIFFASFGAVFGFESFWDAKFPWSGLISCTLLEVFAFETTMFGFALASIQFGQIATFFLAGAAFFVLQTTGSLLRLGLDRYSESFGETLLMVQKVYRLFPPIGELIFDLKQGFSKSFESYEHFVVWAIWFIVFVSLFRLKLGFPTSKRISS